MRRHIHWALLAALLALAGAGGPSARAGGGGWQRLPDYPRGPFVLADAAAGPGGLFVGGERLAPNGPDALWLLESFDPRRSTWAALPLPPSSDTTLIVGLAATRSGLYWLGDDGFTFYGRTAALLDPRTRIWRPLPSPACSHKYGMAAASPAGAVYLLGGGSEAEIGSCTEEYEPRLGRWRQLAPLPFALERAAAAVAPDGSLYVLGGIAITRQADANHFAVDRVLRRVEVYSPATGRWAAGVPMPTARTDLAAVTGADGRIYAIGGSPDLVGHDVRHPWRGLRTVEVYDPRTRRWSALPGLGVGRFDLGAALGGDGRIYAIGGFHRAAVEAYQPVPAAP